MHTFARHCLHMLGHNMVSKSCQPSFFDKSFLLGSIGLKNIHLRPSSCLIWSPLYIAVCWTMGPMAPVLSGADSCTVWWKLLVSNSHSLLTKMGMHLLVGWVDAGVRVPSVLSTTPELWNIIPHWNDLRDGEKMATVHCEEWVHRYHTR